MRAAPVRALVDTDVMSKVVLPGRVTGRSAAGSTGWPAALLGVSVLIAVQTRVELMAWPLLRDWGEARARQLRVALDAVPTVQVSAEVQEAYAQLTATAKLAGHGIHAKEHTGDRWIAATAIAYDLPLATDDRIFRNIPDLALLEPAR